MAGPGPLTIQHYKDLLARIVATFDNLAAAETAGDHPSTAKLRAGLCQLIERAREAARDDA